MRLKLFLTLTLSLYKGEGTRTPQLTIDYHYRQVVTPEIKLDKLSRIT